MKERIRIILQARSNSTRLPGKVLMPISGIPLAVFCAKRLSSRGHDVVLATSVASSDDGLAQVAISNGISFMRGSLTDVYARFMEATKDMGPNDVVVRTTADNPVPDGYFIEELLAIFASLDSSYLGTGSSLGFLPYGVSAEAFTVESLRSRGNGAMDDEEKEHVTSGLRKEAGVSGLIKAGDLSRLDISHLRLTIDTVEDFDFMSNVLNGIADPINEHWRDLVSHFVTLKYGRNSILRSWLL